MEGKRGIYIDFFTKKPVWYICDADKRLVGKGRQSLCSSSGHLVGRLGGDMVGRQGQHRRSVGKGDNGWLENVIMVG